MKWLVALVYLSFPVWAVADSKLPAPRPNILFCIADDASFATFSANGCSWTQTPAFDEVARNGIRFVQAYTPNAKCGPSRSLILTGRNSWQLGAAANHVAFYPAGFRTFMEALGDNGYAIGFTGKGWAPGNPGTVNGKPRELTGPAYSSITDTPPTPIMSNVDYSANFAAFLKQKPKDKPFCFWYGSHDPHRPYQQGSGIAIGHKSITDITSVPPYWPDTPVVRSDMLDYSLAVEYFDKQLGDCLRILKENGLTDNTIVVVTSDNGMPFPRVKGTAYEASMHMPLAIMWPQGINGKGRVVSDYVSFIDYAPTFLDVAGLKPADGGMDPVQGRSLVPIFQRKSDATIQPGRDWLITGQERHDLGRPNDEGYPIRGIFYQGYLYLHNFEPTRWPMGDPITGYLNTDGSPTKSLILANNRKDIDHWMWALDFGKRPADELYDLKNDPDCMANLADKPGYAARRDMMQKKLFDELKRQDDPRMEGKGSVFDHYPYATDQRNLYNRYVYGHEKIKTDWVNDSDYEDPAFDPEHPEAGKAQAIRREDAP
jgi:arylsulfatase A-like enzyme